MGAARLTLSIAADVIGPPVASDRGLAYAADSCIERDGLSIFFQRWMRASFVPDPAEEATAPVVGGVVSLVSMAELRCSDLF
jgi:hypothetical protein